MSKREQLALLDLIEATIGRRKPNLTVREFAQVSGYHPDTIRKMCMSGQLPAHQARKNSPYLIFYTHLADFITTGVAA